MWQGWDESSAGILYLSSGYYGDVSGTFFDCKNSAEPLPLKLLLFGIFGGQGIVY